MLHAVGGHVTAGADTQVLGDRGGGSPNCDLCSLGCLIKHSLALAATKLLSQRCDPCPMRNGHCIKYLATVCTAILGPQLAPWPQPVSGAYHPPPLSGPQPSHRCFPPLASFYGQLHRPACMGRQRPLLLWPAWFMGSVMS